MWTADQPEAGPVVPPAMARVEYAAAEQCLRKAIAGRPGDPVAMAAAYAEARQFDKAVAAGEQAVQAAEAAGDAGGVYRP